MLHCFKHKRATIGKEGEDQVAQWLEKRGYAVLARNYRTRYGEVDIVAQKGDLVVFVEVKRRTNHYFNISEVITKTKQQKIARAARTFIAQHPNLSCSYRFDVGLIEQDNTIVYIEQAFSIESYE